LIVFLEILQIVVEEVAFLPPKTPPNNPAPADIKVPLPGIKLDMPIPENGLAP
jgi:hypothetical protein